MAARNTDIESAALAFIQSYASAMSLAHSTPPTPLPTIAAKLASHYLPNFTSFSLGHIVSAPDAAAATAMVRGHLERLAKAGVGFDVREKGNRVQVVTSGSAMCWITWAIAPTGEKEGGERGWEWENCYLFRRMGDGREGFEGVISDGEIEGLVRHVPGIFG